MFELSRQRELASPVDIQCHTRSSYCILWQCVVVKSLSSMTRLCLHHLQSSEHFQAGHAPPAHPLPRGLCIHEEAVRAVFSSEWAQPSSAQQGPLQPGLSALRGQVQYGRRVDIWIWTPTGPQQHVGFPSSFLTSTLYRVLYLYEWKSKTKKTRVQLQLCPTSLFKKAHTTESICLFALWKHTDTFVYSKRWEITHLHHLKSSLVRT